MGSSHAPSLTTPTRNGGASIMANTDNTTTTRRAILTGIAATTAATAVLAVPAASAVTTDVDAVLAAWRAWRPLEEEGRAISAAIRDLHEKHPLTRKIPSVLVFDQQCVTDENIEEVCQRAPAWMQPAIPQLQESAKRELAAEQKRSEEFNDQVGITQLYNHLEEIDEASGRHFELIDRATGSSPVIIAAQLDLALAHMDGDEDISDCGPRSIVSAIRGLLPELPADMAEALAPIAAGEGTIWDAYTRTATVERRAVS
jgi:hypothetical protein